MWYTIIKFKKSRITATLIVTRFVIAHFLFSSISDNITKETEIVSMCGWWRKWDRSSKMRKKIKIARRNRIGVLCVSVCAKWKACRTQTKFKFIHNGHAHALPCFVLVKKQRWTPKMSPHCGVSNWVHIVIYSCGVLKEQTFTWFERSEQCLKYFALFFENISSSQKLIAYQQSSPFKSLHLVHFATPYCTIRFIEILKMGKRQSWSRSRISKYLLLLLLLLYQLWYLLHCSIYSQAMYKIQVILLLDEIEWKQRVLLLLFHFKMNTFFLCVFETDW